MDARATTDFRDDLEAITVPALVIRGAPHGLNVSHAREFNCALLDFLA
jgi:non-heme chloroperoxidase